MYAVVNTGGKQYKVQQGEVLRVEKIPGDVGSPVTFDRVLMFSDGENVSIGQPVLENIAVEGHIVEQGKAKKIIVFNHLPSINNSWKTVSRSWTVMPSMQKRLDLRILRPVKGCYLILNCPLTFYSY